jgi:hypothetical protein
MVSEEDKSTKNKNTTDVEEPEIPPWRQELLDKKKTSQVCNTVKSVITVICLQLPSVLGGLFISL